LDTVNTIIVGASAAGLAAAACLKRAGISFVLLEQAQQVAASWRNHYDRLHLHTSKRLSQLPDFPMPNDYPQYASRNQVVDYLERYAGHHQLEPVFGQKVLSIVQDGDADGWLTETDTQHYRSRHVVIATGYSRQPNLPFLNGQDEFQGEILHSSAYRNGASYAGKSVLVMGFGNSGGEIAIDLVEHGAQAALSVRHPVNVIPRDILGIPILALALLLNALPAKLADVLSWPLLRLTIGDLRSLGLQVLPYGPMQQIERDHRIPLLDIGTIKLIRAGKIRTYGGVERLTAAGAIFDDGAGKQANFDAIIMATGYRPALADFLPAAAQITDSSGLPLVSGQETALRGLYLCGFYIAPTGMLREIGIEAQRIAAHIQANPYPEQCSN